MSLMFQSLKRTVSDFYRVNRANGRCSKKCAEKNTATVHGTQIWNA